MKYPLALVLVAGAACFTGLGIADIYGDNEGQRAAPPQEMLLSGDCAVPTLNGQAYLAKPPLLYWAIAGLYEATGAITPLTARLPTALCGFVLVLFVYWTGRRFLGSEAAFWGSVGLIASFYFLQRTRLAQLDVPLTLFVFLALIAFVSAVGRTSARDTFGMAALSGAAFGGALLIKGPPAFIFLWAAWIAVTLFLAEDRKRAVLWCLALSAAAMSLEVVVHLLRTTGVYQPDFPLALAITVLGWTGIALVFAGNARWKPLACFAGVMVLGAALASPWAIAVLMRQDWADLRAFLDNQVVERTYTASSINSGGPWAYFIALPVLCAPWGLLLPLQASYTRWHTRPIELRIALLTGWLSVLVFSLIAGKEYEYVLPAFPLLLWGVGFDLVHIREEARRAGAHWLVRGWAPASLAVLLAAGAGLSLYGVAAVSHDGARIVVAVSGLLAFVVAALSLLTAGARYSSIAAAALCVCFAIFGIRAGHWSGDNSYRPMSEFAGQLMAKGHTVHGSSVYPAMAFYAGQPIPIVTDPEDIRAGFGDDAPYFYITLAGEFRMAIEQAASPAAVHELLRPVTNKRVLMLGNDAAAELIAGDATVQPLYAQVQKEYR